MTPNDIGPAAGRLVRWATGAYPPQPAGTPALEVLLESAEQLPLAAELSGPESVVFVPADAPTVLASGAATVPYDGAVTEELSLGGEFFLGAQDYVVSAFITLTAPTLVRVATREDHAAFLADAEHAVATGTFPEQLTNPLALPCDLCCLGGGSCAGSARAYVAADGAVRTTPHGAAGSCLRADVAAAPAPAWLARYLAALAVARAARARGEDAPRVSGFGWRLVPGLEPVPLEPADAPLLVGMGDQHLLVAGRHAFRLGVDAARLIELRLVAGSVEAASERAEDLLGLPITLAFDALTQVVTGLDLPDPVLA